MSVSDVDKTFKDLFSRICTSLSKQLSNSVSRAKDSSLVVSRSSVVVKPAFTGPKGDKARLLTLSPLV